jgi:hypothetical protein
MEPRFGHDFSKVRIHTDQRAVESAQAIDALAYTTGNDIVFNAGEYEPGTNTGKQLLAHELTHVVQQSGADTGQHLMVGHSHDRNEQEADAVSAQIVAAPGSTGDVQHVQKAPINRTEATISRRPANLLVQRQTTNERLSDVEQRQRVLAKRQAATELDVLWRAKFGERIASYREAIARITGGLDAATQGFQAAQVAQSQTDALKTQLIGGMVAIGFAAGFEWAFAGMLGQLGTKAESIEKIIEKVENPANAAVSTGVNLAGVATSTESTNKGQTPAVAPTGGAATGGAMAFLTSNLETLESHSRRIEAAFIKRATSMQNFSDEQWEKFDRGAQEATYQGLLNELNNSGSGIEKLKPLKEVGQVLERHMWALWIQRQFEAAYTREAEFHRGYRVDKNGQLVKDEMPPPSSVDYDVGTDVEVRLNQVGVTVTGEHQAPVTLSGHWYWPNSPGNWRQLLLRWADSYNETIYL